MTLPNIIAARIDRTSSPHGCWLWAGRLDRDGFGRCDLPGRPGALVHRVVYEVHRGPIAAGKVLMHSCDALHGPGAAYRRCVNPEHLTPGTPRQNAEDRSRKGRSPRQRPKAPGAPPGRRYW